MKAQMQKRPLQGLFEIPSITPREGCNCLFTDLGECHCHLNLPINQKLSNTAPLVEVKTNTAWLSLLM
jgi:hypothetical protein